jgi:hypothetical protein
MASASDNVVALFGHDLGHHFEPGNLAQQLGRHQGMPFDGALLHLRQRPLLAQVEQNLRGQGDHAHLRQGGGHLVLPEMGQIELGHDMPDIGADARRPAECLGTEQAQDVRQHFHAAAQRFVKQFAFRGEQPVLLHARLNRSGKILRRARLGKEAEDAPLIHRVDARLQVGISGEHHADAIGRLTPHLPQKLDAADARHPHIRHDHGERAVPRQQFEAVGAVLRRFQPEVFAQIAPVARKHIDVVVDQENSLPHATCSFAGICRHISCHRGMRAETPARLRWAISKS